ncbi:MAG: hypothetical protein IPN95_06995 [Bacteroidetes bacterium]|nr:hypothetical protein [Bacteroidota bacterium]
MESRKTLRRPANWQDFESLCKKLWGEIWKCPEIQQHGRLGQEQFGVDIFGIPKGEDGYFGIQCKGKSEYSHNQFSEEEVITEIEKAKTFEPKLKKFYLATTAPNDSKIQAIIRRIDLEHRAQGLFEVHLFAWEAIVDLIDENKTTHDWYVKSQNYKASREVTVTFDNDQIEIVCKPWFEATTDKINEDDWERNYPPPIAPVDLSNLRLGESPFGHMDLGRRGAYDVYVNRSFYPFCLKVFNSGEEPIVDYKLEICFDPSIQSLAKGNEKGFFSIFANAGFQEIRLSEGGKAKIVPEEETLVPGDSFISNSIYLKPFPRKGLVLLKWKLLSQDFRSEGELNLLIHPEIISYALNEESENRMEESLTPIGFKDYIAKI